MTFSMTEQMRLVRRQADRLVREAGEKIYRNAAERTPVRTGKARANWNCSVGAPDHSVSDEVQYDPDRGSRVFGNARCGDTLVIANFVPYLPFLEKGSLHRAPAGIADGVTEECRMMGIQEKNRGENAE